MIKHSLGGIARIRLRQHSTSVGLNSNCFRSDAAFFDKDGYPASFDPVILILKVKELFIIDPGGDVLICNSQAQVVFLVNLPLKGCFSQNGAPIEVLFQPRLLTRA